MIPFRTLNSTENLHNKMRSYDKRFFIETGTAYMSTLLPLIKNSDFMKLKSVELLQERQQHNQQELNKKHKKLKNKVQLYVGMSDEKLPEMLSDVYDSAVIFLDAHPSGNGSGGDKERYQEGNMHFDGYEVVKRELRTILKHPIKSHIIIIDDIDENFANEELLKIFEEYNLKDNYNFYLSNEGEVADGRKDKLLFCEPK